MNEPVTNGTVVRYHGNIESHHGFYVILNSYVVPEYPGTESEDGYRYTLSRGLGADDLLYGVRRQSFTIVEKVNE